jgi:hypothetical protein
MAKNIGELDTFENLRLIPDNGIILQQCLIQEFPSKKLNPLVVNEIIGLLS